MSTLDPSLTYLALSIASGGAVGGITVGLRAMLGRGDKLARVDKESTSTEATLHDLSTQLRTMQNSMYTRELAERDHAALIDRLDEMRRRISALEERVHGFSLNGGAGSYVRNKGASE